VGGKKMKRKIEEKGKISSNKINSIHCSRKMFGITLITAVVIVLFLPASVIAPTLGSQICGVKFNDINSNGIKDAGEDGLGDWTILLDGIDTAHVVNISVHKSTTTDENGVYCFSGLEQGIYSISEVLQPGWRPTTSLPLGPFQVPNQPIIFDFVNIGNKQVSTPIPALNPIGLLALAGVLCIIAVSIIRRRGK
jgi:hypothetical protein